MSIATGPVSLFGKPFTSLPVGIWVPLVGMAWVFVNVLLVGLGFRTGYQVTCGLLAGGIDGSILASIVLASGYGFHDALSKFKSTPQYVDWLHEHLEWILVQLFGTDEGFHKAVQHEVLWIASTAAVVVLATLIVQLVRTDGNRPAQGH